LLSQAKISGLDQERSLNKSNNISEIEEAVKSGSKSYKMDDSKEKLLQQITAREARHFQPLRMFIILSLFGIMMIITVLRSYKQIGVTKCGAIDWSLFALSIIICLLATFFIVKLLAKQRLEKESCGYNFHESDLEFTTRNSIKLAGLSFVTGMAGSCLGIGGGMIFNPLLLELGMLPTVASGTGMYLVMFASLSTVL